MVSLTFSCSKNKPEPKGFSVTPETQVENEVQLNGIAKDSPEFEIRPGNVLLTGMDRYRLTTIFKVNMNKRTNTTFIGSISSYENYSEINNSFGNQWHYHYMPGFEAVYGYNMVNISYYDIALQKQKYFFDHPVLVKTLYYPSFSTDTLNFNPVHRDYFMISVYDEDSNRDGYLNENDLRHFYHIDNTASSKTALVPANYSVISSEYDPGNDYMYVFAKMDLNKNGRADEHEEINIFWIDLKHPGNNGKLY